MMASSRSKTRLSLRGVRRALLTGVLALSGATAIAPLTGAGAATVPHQFVLNPVVGNAQFATLRGTGYEASVLAGESALGITYGSPLPL